MLLALVLLSLSLLAVGVTPANPEAVILLEIAGVLTAGRTAGLIPSWNISTGGPCNWDGIDCDDNNNVVGLRLPQRSLAGSIPSTGWDQLDGLLVIQLSGNNLAGSIPADWNLPRSLTDLDVSDNRLNGTIPSAWQLPSSLQRLYLYANDLTGTIPADWPLPDSLQELLLAQNRLSGPLPQPWALPASLQKLWLSENSLGGTLPGNWSLPSGLLALELFKNQLTGSIPASLQLPSSLVNLTLYENKLTGPLPGNWTLPASLQVLFLYSNQLTGTLPSPWALPATLRQLSVAFNLLHGPLPSSWKLPEGLQVLELHSNQFSGTLDSAWRLPSTLHQLVLSNNSLTGSIPSSWPGTGASSLVYLAMDQNALQGPIPADWQLPDSLQELDLSLNALTGDLSWDPPSNLTWLNLSYNKLRGPVRANWALPPALTTLLLNENSLTGTLPAELAVPESMQDIELAFNPDLEGSLPSNWSLPNLKVGVFFGCNFTGPLPEWKVPTTAKVVALPQAGTGFCGEVPTTTPYYQRGASNDTLLDSGPGALPNCTAPECTDCTNTDPGQRLVLPAGGAPYYTSPCATNGPAGALAKCATFNTSGTRAASSCAEGQCYLEASIDGATYYLLDFECGSATAAAGASNFGAPGDAQCATGGGGGGGSSSGSSSSGAVIGVAVGCSVAAVVAGAGLWVWLARRRRAKRLDAEKSLPPSPPLKDGSFTSPFEAADESWKDSNGGIKVLRRTVTDSAEGDPFTRNKSTKLTNGSSRAGSAATDQVIALAMRASRSEGSGGLTVSPRQMSSRSSLSADLKLWEVDFNSLELVKQIGEGSFGRVYMAKWHELLVAVKILLSASGEDMTEEGMKQALTLSNPVLENLHKEAGMMAAMRHPHIVNFLGVCPCPPCVVTEYCSRGSLTDVLKQAKQSPAVAARLDWYQRLQMMMDTAKGMLYLHSHKPPIIHRDLKSPNLLVDVHWRVKVSDFNLSKILEDTLLLSSAQATNPRWLAPEVLAGASATMCSDVYSFGVVLWEMMTWKIPFAEENHWQLVRFVADGGRLELPSRDLLPGRDTAAFDGLDDYTALIRRCWAQAPEDRPTFQEIVDALRDMMARASRLRSGPGGPVPRPSSQPSSQPQSQLPSVGSNGVGSSGSASNLASPALPGAGPSHQASDSSLAGGTASLAPSMPGSVSAQQGSVASTAAAALDSASSITSPARPARAGVAPALDSASSGT